MESFLIAESAAKAAIGTTPVSVKGVDESQKDFILRSWEKRQALPCLFSLTTKDSIAEYFPSALMVRGIVSRPDKFGIFFRAVKPKADEVPAGNYWVNGLDWWRVNHVTGREYFSFQYLDPNYGGPFMLNAMPFGDTHGLSPYKQLINLVERFEAEFSETPEAFVFVAAIPKSERGTESSEEISVSSWGQARVEISVHKQTLQPTTIRVTSSEGEITCKIEYLETLLQFDESTLDYSAPHGATILYDERE